MSPSTGSNLLTKLKGKEMVDKIACSDKNSTLLPNNQKFNMNETVRAGNLTGRWRYSSVSFPIRFSFFGRPIEWESILCIEVEYWTHAGYPLWRTAKPVEARYLKPENEGTH